MSNLGVKTELNKKYINAAQEFIKIAFYIPEEKQACI